MENFLKILYYILAVIACGNISVAVFLTIIRIEKADQSKKGIAAALYFVFTVLGMYAVTKLLK